MTMKKATLVLLVILILGSCNNKESAPDISGIKVGLSTNRFDQDFFSMDTLQVEQELTNLQQKYPELLPLFLQHIVGVQSSAEVKAFYRSYKPIFDSSQKVFKDFGSVREDLEKALRYVKYYFPNYKIPTSIVAVLGPMNSREDLARMANGDYTPNFIGPGFVGVSLQFYLGSDFSLYHDEYFVNNVAPLYRSRRFSKEYIIPDVMKLITDDIFPDKSNTLSLVEQMIEKGKQWWLMDKFLPGMEDSLKTGYTKEQLDWCRENEGLIWSYFLKNENLYALDPPTIQTYIGEGPFTQGFSQEQSPGNIGQWIGLQIVKKFVANNPGMKIEEVMQAAPKKILEEAKYKPK